MRTLHKRSLSQRGMAEPKMCENWAIESKLAKIILHLGDEGSRRYVDKWDAPASLTQTLIADAIGMSRSNMSRYAPDLKAWGFVEQKVKHILGASRKRNAYFLTPDGMTVYELLRTRRNMDERIQNADQP